MNSISVWVERSANLLITIQTEIHSKEFKPVKAPNSLCEAWSLWYFEKKFGKSWEQCFHEVATCKSLEEFWILFNSIKLATEINEGCNYALFRSTIRPMWEDEYNRAGGRWIITLDKRVDSDEVNRLWLDTLLMLIEEKLSFSSSICGVIFHNRWKFIKIGRTRVTHDDQYVTVESLQAFGCCHQRHMNPRAEKFGQCCAWQIPFRAFLKIITSKKKIQTKPLTISKTRMMDW